MTAGGTRRLARLLGLVALAPLVLEGCVTVYQPLVSLQRPVVVDPGSPNLEGVKLKVRCIPGDIMETGQAQDLCRRATTLFSNQGAQVRTEVPVDGRSTSSSDDGEKPDLVLDLDSRLLHKEENKLLAGLSGVTLTIVPAVTEESFAQDITIRDGEGALLATDSFQARFITYVGIAAWAVNWLLDFAIRDEPDELTGDVAKLAFSKDLYGQLSQVVFNAHVRSKVLRGFATRPPEQPKPN